MSKAKKLASDALSWLLCICLVIGWGGVSNLFLNTQQAHAVDVGVNPTPKVDMRSRCRMIIQGRSWISKRSLRKSFLPKE